MTIRVSLSRCDHGARVSRLRSPFTRSPARRGAAGPSKQWCRQTRTGPRSRNGHTKVTPYCLESLPILQPLFGISSNTLVRSSDTEFIWAGRAAHPTATGWDEELRARTAGVRLPRPGRSKSSFGRIQVMLRHWYR